MRKKDFHFLSLFSAFNNKFEEMRFFFNLDMFLSIYACSSSSYLNSLSSFNAIINQNYAVLILNSEV